MIIQINWVGVFGVSAQVHLDVVLETRRMSSALWRQTGKDWSEAS